VDELAKSNERAATEICELFDALIDSVASGEAAPMAHDKRAKFAKAVEELGAVDLRAVSTPDPHPSEDDVTTKNEKKTPSIDAVLKGLPEDQRAVVEVVIKAAAVENNVTLAKRLETAEGALAKMLEDKRTIEFIGKARELKLRGIDVEKLGSILKRSHEASEELAADVTAAFKALSAQIGKANVLFESIGVATGDGSADATSDGMIEKRAREIVKAGESSGTTFEQAYVQALDENPDLYSNSLGAAAAVE
jgi:hypothetical protein